MLFEETPKTRLKKVRAFLTDKFAESKGGWFFFVLIALGMIILGVILHALTVGGFGLIHEFPAARVVFGTVLALVVGAIIIYTCSGLWLDRIEKHPLLRSDEKLQNKDAIVIATTSMLALHLGLCIVAAGAAVIFKEHALSSAFLSLTTALAAVAVGGSFGFLLGHPRRLADADAAKDGRTGSTWLIKTGLDDIVDWLVKGVTTVLLVDAKYILMQLGPLATSVGIGIAGVDEKTHNPQSYAFALAIIVYFTLFGVGATCLVTRTYLTGALGRADRSTVNAFTQAGLHWGEILTLVNAQRSLGSRGGGFSSEVLEVAKRLAALSLCDLHTPQEFALWAKAKSSSGDPVDAIRGYEKALALCDCDPALLLDYAVALNDAGNKAGSVKKLELALQQISSVTDIEVQKNIYKSLTYALLYGDNQYQRVIELAEEYFTTKNFPYSGGIRVNEVCAYGQCFYASAIGLDLVFERDLSPDSVTKKVLCVFPADKGKWPEPMIAIYDKALSGIIGVLKKNLEWRSTFIRLLSHNDPDKDRGEDDLEIFEAFPDFRQALGLPPLPNVNTPLNKHTPNSKRSTTPAGPLKTETKESSSQEGAEPDRTATETKISEESPKSDDSG